MLKITKQKREKYIYSHTLYIYIYIIFLVDDNIFMIQYNYFNASLQSFPYQNDFKIGFEN